MRTAAGLRSDEAAIWSSQSLPGFERQPASWPLPLRRALAERFPAHIDGGRFAPLVHRSSSDAGAQYALTDAGDSRPFEEPDARWHGHAGARRAGARRRTAKTRRWLRPIRLGIGASNCATRSAPSSNSCAAPSRSCARNSIRRTRRSEAADSAIRTQARHSGSSPKPGPGAAVAFGRRCENVSCCSIAAGPAVEARDQPPGESVSDHVQGGPLALHSHGPGRRSAGGRKGRWLNPTRPD